MRLQDRPRFRAGGAVRFADFFAAARAVRAIAQAGLYPANCRILDPRGGATTPAPATAASAIMVLAFESADHPLDAWMVRALECCADHGGAAGNAGRRRRAPRGRGRAVAQRLHPHALCARATVRRAMIADTFETAITWERFEAFHDRVKAGDRERRSATRPGGAGQVTCRFTHVYPDGPAPYFSFHALGRHGALRRNGGAIKSAASDALIAAGGTITHHHAVGRDHRPWYDRQRPALFAAALARQNVRSTRRAYSIPGC